MSRLTRRDVLKMGLAGGAAMLLSPRMALSDEALPVKTDVWVFHGGDRTKLMQACLKRIGDEGGFGPQARKLTLKVNAAWYRTPEQAANTNPELVDVFLKGAKDQGIGEIVIPEHPVDAAAQAFARSGLQAVADSHSAPMIDLKAGQHLFTEVEIPRGRTLQKALVAKEILETDALVNIPVAKHHGGPGLTISMKNWMGSVWDRGEFHRSGLHECIADISSVITPTWTIVDAIQIMINRGPKGPGELVEKNMLVLSRDQVAADAFTSTLFPNQGPEKIGYLRLAQEMGLGVADLSRIDVHRVEVA